MFDDHCAFSNIVCIHDTYKLKRTLDITFGFVDPFRSVPGQLEDEGDSMTYVTSADSPCYMLVHRSHTCKLSNLAVVIYHNTTIFENAASSQTFRINFPYSFFIQVTK